MNRETMFHNVNLKFAQAATVKQPKRYGSNEPAVGFNRQLIQKINHIRGLEDELLQLQYQRELLIEQNQAYKDALEKLKRNNEIQQEQIRKLDQEAEMHRQKNRQLATCDQNLRSLYEEIEQLTSIAEKKHEECELMQEQKSKLLVINDNLTLRKQDLISRNNVADIRVEQYFRSCGLDVDNEIEPLGNLRIRLERLLEARERLKLEEVKIKKEHKAALALQQQTTIKLQYEEQLLKQRLQDAQKNQQIARICETQSNLQSMVEDMLKKEDQLVKELKHLELEYQKDDQHLRQTMERLEDQWAEQRENFYRQLRELRATQARTSDEIEELQRQIKEQLEIQKKIGMEYELICRLRMNLSSMQKLRQVEQRNNYLKLKIKEQSEIRDLLVQEKQLSSSTRHHESKAATSHYHSTFDFEQYIE